MAEIGMTPLDYFKSQQEYLIPVNINGIDTYVLKKEDSKGKYFAIPATDKRLSNICCLTILDHYIYAVYYDHHDNNVAVIKAYYR